MITSLRSEACSGAIDDLGHVTTDVQMADCLTKDKPILMQTLMKTVLTGVIPKADQHPPFREMMKKKHKAYLGTWITRHIKNASEVVYFLMVPIREQIQEVLYGSRVTPGN